MGEDAERLVDRHYGLAGKLKSMPDLLRALRVAGQTDFSPGVSATQWFEEQLR